MDLAFQPHKIMNIPGVSDTVYRLPAFQTSHELMAK